MTPLHRLETRRLRLREWDGQATDNLHAMHANPFVARYLDAHGRVYDRAKAQERVAGWLNEYANHGIGKFWIERKDDGAFIGRAGISPFNGEPEIGYSLAAEHWGQGFASEIAFGLRDWFFANRAEPHFVGFAHVENKASLRVLAKIGMRETYRGVLADMPHQFFVLTRVKWENNCRSAQADHDPSTEEDSEYDR